MAEEDLQKKKFNQMTTQSVERLVCKMAVPSIISMLVSAFYNMADTFFIEKITVNGTAAMGAVGVVFSYMALIQAEACKCGGDLPEPGGGRLWR